jgi:ATP-dependent helicase/nuclease subunit A
VSALAGWHPQQLEAIERRGTVFVSAGAGTGKTAVLVERVVRRVQEGTPLDRVLVITFTDRAAAELKRRVRERLTELGHGQAARAVEGAWISTIHGFCRRVLRANALEAGVDPRFQVASDTEARLLADEAFAVALERFVADDEDDRLDLLAGYRRDRLRRMTTELHDRLRGLGVGLDLRPYQPANLPAALDAARAAALELPGDEPAEHLLELLAGDPAPLALLEELPRLRGSTAEPRAAYRESLKDLEQAAVDAIAERDRALLEQLLSEYDAAYRQVKDDRGLLDFNDLELRARDLLRSSPAVTAAYRDRFVEVMVDEFQDTNRLQVELVELVRGGDLFVVGDEFQSIYRFRRADVDVYREQRRQAGDEGVSLASNFRSRPHVLELVNEVFGREFGSSYTPLEPGAEFAGEPPGDGAAEVLLTDREAFDEHQMTWREAEAQAIAGRVSELVQSGACRQGEVVLLFEAGTDAGIYEDALRARGLQTVLATGRGYYEQREVNDLLAYLRLLRNRTDDAALLGVLASPLVGMSNDGLALLRLATRRRGPAIGAFDPGRMPPDMGEDDTRMAKAFLLRYERLTDLVRALGLERLCERIVTEHDFDLALLARRDGDRRMANVRKLIRLAREFETVRGPDLEGFVRFCDDQANLAAREGDAAIADEGGDAVVLMTVHAAKGLEFDVVVVADAGREVERRPRSDVLVDRDGHVALRAVRPDTGVAVPALGYDALFARESEAERQEGRRLQYVAMTRARHHLILSGGLKSTEDATAIGQLCRTLDIGLETGGPVTVGGAGLHVRVERPVPEDPRPSGPDQLLLFGDGQVLAPPARLEPLTAVPQPPAVPVRRLSYSGLALFDRCGYRFYAQRVLRLPERAREQPEVEGMQGVEIGDAVHLLLERDDERWRLRYPHATATDEEWIERMVESWRESSLARRVAALEGARRELSFSFEVDDVLFRGRFDLYHRGPDGTVLVVDYKTNLLGDRDVEQIVEDSYRHQVTIYALAALLTGAERVEVVYAFLDRPDAVVTRVFEAGDAERLRDELAGMVATVREGRFEARPGPQCADCPALDLLCAGPALVTA